MFRGSQGRGGVGRGAGSGPAGGGFGGMRGGGGLGVGGLQNRMLRQQDVQNAQFQQQASLLGTPQNTMPSGPMGQDAQNMYNQMQVQQAQQSADLSVQYGNYLNSGGSALSPVGQGPYVPQPYQGSLGMGRGIDGGSMIDRADIRTPGPYGPWGR